MKIAVFDPTIFKFSSKLIEHWQEQGHEVKKDRYFDPALVHWADIVLFDWVDNNLIRGSDAEDPIWKEYDPQPQDKKIIARMHDIDYWTGNGNRVNWDWVDKVVFVGQHIMDRAIIDRPQIKDKSQIINHGINLDQFTLRENEDKMKFAWIGNVNHQKQPELALVVFSIIAQAFPEAELSMIGSGWKSWEAAYRDYFVEQNNLKVTFHDNVESINDFLEDKEFLLTTSSKEAWGYVIAEAMAKGVKPLIHNFYGCDKIWPEHLVWNSPKDLLDIIGEGVDKASLRKFIEDNYPQSQMFKEWDKLIV